MGAIASFVKRRALTIAASISGVWSVRFHRALLTEDENGLATEDGEQFYTEGLRYA